MVRPPFPLTALLAALSFPPFIVRAGSFFSDSFPGTALPFWQLSFPFTLLFLATLFSFNALHFPEEGESEEDEELVDEVTILSPEEELTEDGDDESGFVFWEEFFLVVAVVPSSAVPPGCVAAVPVPFKVGGIDGTFAGVAPPNPDDPADSPRW